jgi:hypothetical protein
MKKALVLALFLSISAPAIAGCGATLGTIIATVLTVVQDAVLILDNIESFVNSTESIPAETKAKIDNVLKKCRVALAVANHAAASGQALNSKDVQAALKEFELAFTELMDLIGKYGVVMASDGNASGAPAALVIPRPRALDVVNELSTEQF